MTLHSYPWYPADWLGSETRARLTQAGRSIYREILDFCWRDGSVSADHDTLIGLIGCTRREFRAAWQVIAPKFTERDGRLYNARVDERRPELVDWREARREAGRRGGKSRSKAQAELKQVPSYSLSKTEAELEQNASSAQANGKPSLSKTEANAKPSSSSPSSSSSVKPETVSRERESRVSGGALPPLSLAADPDAEFLRVARLLCETLPAGGDVHRVVTAMRAEFARSASYEGAPLRFAKSIESAAIAWRAAYDDNRELRGKPAQYWLADGTYAQKPPQPRQRIDPGPVYLGEGAGNAD